MDTQTNHDETRLYNRTQLLRKEKKGENSVCDILFSVRVNVTSTHNR